MTGKGMEPKKGYDFKKWQENFVKIMWKAKSPAKKCKCTKGKDSRCKCQNSNPN